MYASSCMYIRFEFLKCVKRLVWHVRAKETNCGDNNDLASFGYAMQMRHALTFECLCVRTPHSLVIIIHSCLCVCICVCVVVYIIIFG